MEHTEKIFYDVEIPLIEAYRDNKIEKLHKSIAYEIYINGDVSELTERCKKRIIKYQSASFEMLGRWLLDELLFSYSIEGACDHD